MITTAFNFGKATKKRNLKIGTNLEGGMNYEVLFESILNHDFSFACNDGQEGFNPLVNFLKQNKFTNFLAFLQLVEKDKRQNGEFYLHHINHYKRFFN